jgi:hypothetical protein
MIARHMPSPAIKALLGVLLLAAQTVRAGAPPPALEQFQQLQSSLRAAHQAHDWQANLTGALKLQALLNGAPDSHLEVARARLLLGDTAGALRDLTGYARMGQAADLPAVSADFTPLVPTAGYARLQQVMQANARPIALGAPFLTLNDPALLTEDVDFEPRTRQFLITSVREHKIVALGVDGRSRDFAVAPDGWPLLALKIDAAHAHLWVTEVALRGLSFSPAADWGRGALLCYDLGSGRLLRRIEAPKDSNLGDMLLTSAGDVIVSDGDGGGVYRLSAAGTALQRIDHGDFISPQTPALHPDGRHIFVPDYLRGIALLELATGRVRWLSMADRYALNGIDGLYFAHGQLLAVQNGTAPARVAAFRLDATLTRIAAERILARQAAGLDPTHGVVVGADFYYLSPSGWEAIDDHGNLKPGVMLRAAQLLRIPLAEIAQSRARIS